ncbi:hypothetical protein MPSEU_000180900 [Mayamaea pseudoterrestris]|nr:hypothetical protein MPSEU_000180900 [Mayamaea pseudoterrestris]
MSDGKQLWKTLLQTIQKPVEKEETKASSFQSTMQLRILTGCPMFHAAAHDKYQWCTRELGFATLHIPKTGPKHQQRDPLKQCLNKIQIVTCRSKEKHLQSGRNCILIDDRLDLQAAWEQKGGIFIHHTSTATTLQQLQDKGILTAETLAKMNENKNGDENARPSATEQKPVVMYPEDEEPGTDDEEY